MRLWIRCCTIVRLLMFVVVVLGACEGRVLAQGPRLQAGLGGYGAAAGMPAGSMGSGALIIPYGGQFAGFMPSRMAAGGGLAFTNRGTSAIGPNRRPFALSAIAGSAGMTAGARSLLAPSRGLDLGSSGSMTGMSNGIRSSVAPPSFAYPFYQPPPLFGTAGAGAGMSSM